MKLCFRESQDSRNATNVKNSNKVTLGTGRLILEYGKIRLIKTKYP